jgi:HSP20 family molecular chaperone IbpA
MTNEDMKALMWRPFLDFPYLEDFEDERWKGDSFHRKGLSISEDDKSVYVEADLPGMRAEDIELIPNSSENFTFELRESSRG